ncbi:MAG: biotin/lipoyl-binding protein [Clostridia bacterium]|jgi:biotin carboxyl carrier protein|nr:biotin/lipoyl-binding protein [Clostridia bacterium]
MLRTFRITINNEEYQVQVEEITGESPVREKNTAVQSVPQTEAAPIPPKEEGTLPKNNASPGQTAVLAPLPGTVLKIPVTKGQKVNANETVLILEAMKMENEITAPKEGIIGQIMVSQGQNVNTGDTLLTIE